MRQAQWSRGPADDAQCHDASYRREHRDVDAGQSALLLGKVLLVAYLMESSIRVQEQNEIGRGQLNTRLSPQPCIFIRVRSSVTIIARDMISYA